MAEYCLDCWNEINETNDNAKKYIFSNNLELCEGCGEYKKVIVTEKRFYYFNRFGFLLFPFKIIYKALFLIYKHIKGER